MTSSLDVLAGSFSDHPFVIRISHHIPLTQADVNALEQIIERERIAKKRSDIVVEGYECCHLGFIDAGVAIQYKVLPNGNRQVFSVLFPGDVLGLPNCFYERAIFSIMAITEVRMRTCSLDSFLSLCDQRPHLASVLFYLMVDQCSTYAQHIIDAARRSPTERVAHFLIEVHSHLKELGQAEPDSMELPLSQEVIADVLGLSSPHVNRVLRQLRVDGLITTNGRNIIFKDLEALKAMGRFERVALKPIRYSSAGSPDQTSLGAERVNPGAEGV